MKTRLLLLIAVSLMSGLEAVGQAATKPASDFVNYSFRTSIPAQPLLTYAGLQDDQKLAPPFNPAVESSSRKHRDEPPLNGSAAAPSQTSTGLTECEEPAKLFSAREYTGPLSRMAAWFTRKPEMATVPGRRPGARICSLDVREKFMLFAKTTIDPVTFVGAAASAGYSQWQDNDSDWGQGAEGYGKRYAAAFADRLTRNFFRKFFYPAIFQQDPRYYRQGHGSTSGRLGHAIAHTFVARSDAGRGMANLSLWTGTASTVAVENLYHPGNDRGFAPAAKRFGISIGGSMGTDLLREFWPELVRALRLPFKDRPMIKTTTP